MLPRRWHRSVRRARRRLRRRSPGAARRGGRRGRSSPAGGHRWRRSAPTTPWRRSSRRRPSSGSRPSPRRAARSPPATGAAARPTSGSPGPGRFRDRLLARSAGAEELAALLAGPAAAELYLGTGGGGLAGAGADPRALAAAGRLAAAVEAWAAAPPQSAAERLEQAAALYGLGRFARALEVLGAARTPAALILRLRCQVELGALGAAKATLRRLAAERLAPAEVLDAAEPAARALANSGEPERAAEWVARALGAVRAAPQLAPRAELLAANAAWDRGDYPAMERHLTAARPAATSLDPDLAWRWHQASGLRAMAAGDGAGFVASLTAALRWRRRLLRHQAAGLWNDLGIGRVQAGDLPGAERALLASRRLFAGCDGPRHTTLALLNLAEVRLRRGHLGGVREILEQSTAENRLAGNVRGLTQDTELWARFELVMGRPGAALALCRDALARLDREGIDWHRAELATLAARALGWLGRPDEAAAELARAGDAAGAELEPEERPALFAHAAARDEALARAAGTPWAGLWEAALAVRSAPALGSDAGDAPRGATEAWNAAWEAASRLGPYRAARLAFDLEMAAPGSVPAALRRAAAAELQRIGASFLAERLEIRDEGAWEALAAFFAHPGEPAGLPELFVSAGYSAAELVLHRDEGEGGGAAEVLVPGSGGEGGETLAAGVAGGRLVLAAPRLDPTLRALFAVAAATLAAGPRSAQTSAALPGPGRGDGLVGESLPLLRALERAERLAGSDLPVLVLGESGTGKELVARRIHRASRRARAPFVAVNCAALSETLLLSDLFGHQRGAFTGADRERAGVFEAAHAGTVFLDEIGDLPAAAQGMLLRVLQEGEVRRLGESLPRKVDVRVVAATHRDLTAMVAAGSFREDLYYRLNVGSVELPPLRERGRDVVLLAESFLAGRGEASPPPRLSRAAAARLLAHRWSGNVRELQNVLSVAALLAEHGVIEPAHLDLPLLTAADGGRAAGYHQQIDDMRRRLVSEALAASGGRQAAAARRLGISRQALSYLVRQLGMMA